jgi:ubiquinone/menaquinone biosynthesis C-methylase UbiE
VSSTSAFDGLASTYQRYRPRYPDALLGELRAFALSGDAFGRDRPLVLDVGSGTGISTRLLRATFGPRPLVVGVEPGRDMRREAVADTLAELDVAYVSGLAEALPFADGEAAVAVAAQALQWFDRPAFYREARRVLAAGGTLAVLQNNRDWSRSDALRVYEEFLEAHSPGYSRFYRAFDVQAELEAVEGIEPSPPLVATWTRTMTADEFVGMTQSSTKMRAAIDAIGEESAVRTLAAALGPHCRDGVVEIPYRSELYRARRLLP